MHVYMQTYMYSGRLFAIKFIVNMSLGLCMVNLFVTVSIFSVLKLINNN